MYGFHFYYFVRLWLWLQGLWIACVYVSYFTFLYITYYIITLSLWFPWRFVGWGNEWCGTWGNQMSGESICPSQSTTRCWQCSSHSWCCHPPAYQNDFSFRWTIWAARGLGVKIMVMSMGQWIHTWIKCNKHRIYNNDSKQSDIWMTRKHMLANLYSSMKRYNDESNIFT